MADFIQVPFKKEEDIKLFILYLLDAVGRPLDFVEFHDIIVQNGLVKSFDFCLLLPELIRSGMIHEEKQPDGTELFSITPFGHDTVETLQSSLLHMTRERTLNHALMLLEMKKTNSNYRCGVTQLAPGRYEFCVRFTQNLADVLTVAAVCPTELEAERMRVDFERRPDVFYRALVSILNNRISYFNKDNPMNEF